MLSVALIMDFKEDKATLVKKNKSCSVTTGCLGCK